MRNRGELAEGWYDPATLERAQASAVSNSTIGGSGRSRRQSPEYNRQIESSDDDGPGPALPSGKDLNHQGNKRSGPAIPNLQDLELQRGTIQNPPELLLLNPFHTFETANLLLRA